MKVNSITAVLSAIAAAVFYALNTPLSKLLLNDVPAVYMAAFLYLGAGVGVGIIYAFRYKKEPATKRLGISDLPYTIGMVVLDIIAPILLMLGISLGSASSASLLGNFEIVATALIALLLFKEKISPRLWLAIALITVSGIILSLGEGGTLSISSGSLPVIGATCCWGLENNCTRRISGKSTYQIVTVKGLCSGTCSMVIAAVTGESMPDITHILPTMLLGFVAYGLSIFTYIRAQSVIGAAKTGAFYSIAPFVAAFLSLAINGEPLTSTLLVAIAVMAVGTVFALLDTIKNPNP